MVDFSKYQKKAVSEPIESEEKDTPKEPFSEPEKTSLVKNIGKKELIENSGFVGIKNIESDGIADILREISMNKSAMLNLNKFLYAVFTGKSTTNKLKKEIKQTNLEYIRKW